ncbi:MAG: transposase [Exilibacterium sp.]
MATKTYRQKHTVPALALEVLKKWLDKTQPKVNPKGLLGQAISYTQNQFEKLKRFSSSGVVPISNIFCEQQAKKVAVGAKIGCLAMPAPGPVVRFTP